jgi:hypothetical protein
MKKVFLGGTCNNSTWRNELIKKLTIDYFDPVVPDWTEECAKEEIRQRENCDFCLYVITPEILGYYSIAEVTEDAIKRPNKTIFAYLTEANGLEFNKQQIKSLEAIGKLIERNKAVFLKSLDEVANYLNNK